MFGWRNSVFYMSHNPFSTILIVTSFSFIMFSHRDTINNRWYDSWNRSSTLISLMIIMPVVILQLNIFYLVQERFNIRAFGSAINRMFLWKSLVFRLWRPVGQVRRGKSTSGSIGYGSCGSDVINDGTT
jgi:hypothetical protein